MSIFSSAQPVSVKTWPISIVDLASFYKKHGITALNPSDPLDYWFTATDLDGYVAIQRYMIQDSALYKAEKFDCEDFALYAQCLVAKDFGINAVRLFLGDSPLGYHGFLGMPVIEDGVPTRILLFEPQDGFEFSGQLFDPGQFGYVPKRVLL